MSRERTILLILVLLAILTVGAWALSTVRTSSSSTETESPEPSATFTPSVTIDLPLALHHKVEGKTHTYRGSVWVPSVCDSLASGILARDMNPSHITIEVSINRTECATAEKTQTDFSVSFSGTGTESPVIDAVTFNEMEVPFTVTDDK